MLFLTNIFLYKYEPSYRVKGLHYIYKFPKIKLFTYSEKKRPYRNLTSVGLINYLNPFDHANLEKNNSFLHYFADSKYLYSNIKTILLK
jgi:hypothetical protein